MMLKFLDTNLIGTMPWEDALCELLGVHYTVLRMILSLFVSVPIGLVFRHVPTTTGRYLYCLITGLVLSYYPFGNEVFYSVPPMVATYLAMLLAPERCGTWAWVINFPYLIWCHAINATTTLSDTGEIDFTGALMVLMLKMISVATAYQDACTVADKDMRPYPLAKKVSTLPSVLGMLTYVHALGSLLVGPTFEYADFNNFVKRRGPWSPTAEHPMPSTLLPALRQVAMGIGCLAAHLVGVSYFDEHTLQTEWYAALPLPARIAVQIAVCVAFRFKFYFVWSLSEGCLTAAGLGFNGVGTDGTPQFDRLQCHDIVKVELQESPARTPIYWNMQTGAWLRNYVYDRLTPIGAKPTFFTLAVTQMVAGLWHGLYPGQLAFFVGSMFMIESGKVMFKQEQRLPKAVLKSWPYKGMKIVWTMSILDTLGAPFVIVSWKESLDAMKSVYFTPPIIAIVITALGGVLPSPRRPKREGVEPKKEE